MKWFVHENERRKRQDKKEEEYIICVVTYGRLLNFLVFIHSYERSFVPTTCGTPIHIDIQQFIVCWAQERRGFARVILRLCFDGCEQRNKHYTQLNIIFFQQQNKCQQNEMLLIWHRLYVISQKGIFKKKKKQIKNFHCQWLSIVLTSKTLIILFCTEHAS